MLQSADHCPFSSQSSLFTLSLCVCFICPPQLTQLTSVLALFRTSTVLLFCHNFFLLIIYHLHCPYMFSHLPVIAFFLDCLTLKTGLLRCPQTPVTFYQPALSTFQKSQDFTIQLIACKEHWKAVSFSFILVMKCYTKIKLRFIF